MMDTRFVYLIIGCVFGFFVGYVVRSLREIKGDLVEVDKHIIDVEKHGGKRDMAEDEGSANATWLNRVALFLTVALTAYSAFVSQHSTNTSKQAVADERAATQCVQEYLTATIIALNARTQFSGEQSAANVELQRAQTKFLSALFSKPAPTNAQVLSAYSAYLTAQNKYLSVGGKTSTATKDNPYPSSRDFMICITKAK